MRILIAFTPLVVFVPMLLIPIAPYVFISLGFCGVYIFWPYATAWPASENVPRNYLLSEHGELLTLLHWVLVGIVYMVLARKMSNKHAMVTWLILASISIVCARALIHLAGYEVEIKADF